MLGGLFNRWEEYLEAGARARILHGTWLSRALSSPEGSHPRIPTRRVSDGGFSGLMRTREGRAWVEHWWESAWGGLDDE